MTYSDIVKNGLVLPKKEKYTKADYKKLIAAGCEAKKARFICICSAVYYDTEYSKFFNCLKLRAECGII